MVRHRQWPEGWPPGPRGGPPGRGQGRRGTRCRWWIGEPEGWEVHARIERFVEPALLLLLRDGSLHGYDLAEALQAMAPDDRVDLGNLYRLLRSLEYEGLVSSTWRDDLPGRAKRTYQLTDTGRQLLDQWAAALERASENIAAFLRRYHDEEQQQQEEEEQGEST